MNPSRLPITQELFEQWQRARGRRAEPASRPFSRNWEELLKDAGLCSATECKEAETDVHALEDEGWLGLKNIRYMPHFIDSVFIPLAAEIRWREAFGFVPPSDEETRQICEFSWAPELAFVPVAKLNLLFSELRLLNEFFKAQRKRVPAPIKERSLQIFGDEKRLDQLLRSSALFQEGRLTLEMLRCFIVAEPLPWMPGPTNIGPVLVIENAATWHSYRQWNSKRQAFSAVVYGCGNRFVDSVTAMKDIFAALDGVRQVFYFGDLDPRGLSIPQEASARALASGLPPIEPHLWSYRQLLMLGEGRSQPYDGTPPATCLCDWLGEVGEAARQILAAGQRLPQEYVGWEFLRELVL